MSNALIAQCQVDIFEHLLRLNQFSHFGDHGEHDTNAGLGAGTQDCTQLVLEQAGFFQREPDRAHSQKRVGFIGQFNIGQFFVATDV